MTSLPSLLTVCVQDSFFGCCSCLFQEVAWFSFHPGSEAGYVVWGVTAMCEKWGGNMRKVRQRHIWVMLQHGKEGMQTGPCPALHTSRACLARKTDVGDKRAYLRHTHSSKFSSTDYWLITFTALWKNVWCLLCYFICKVYLSYSCLICSLSVA